VADLCGKKGVAGSGLGLDCTDCGVRVTAPHPSPPPLPSPPPPLSPPPIPFDVEFEMYMYHDGFFSDTLIWKLRTAICTQLLNALMAANSEFDALEADCAPRPAHTEVYEAQLINGTLPEEMEGYAPAESFGTGESVDMRVCLDIYGSRYDLEACVSDGDFGVNNTYPIVHTIFDIAIHAADEMQANAIILALAAYDSASWSFGRNLDLAIYENVQPSGSGRVRLAAGPPVAACPALATKNGLYSCCATAPIVFGDVDPTTGAQDTWQSSCNYQATKRPRLALPPPLPEPPPRPEPPLPEPPPPPEAAPSSPAPQLPTLPPKG